MEEVAFFAGAIGALGGAIAVIALRNPFYAVLALVVHLVSLAGLFLILHAEFVAAAQVVVYAGAIVVLYVFVAAENTPEHQVSAGERYAAVYEINLSRCIFCGYCEVACPFDAITMGHEYEISDYNRSDLIFTKEMLLAEPLDRTPLRREGE